MIDFLEEHFDAILTSFITIVGFIATYQFTKRNLKNELQKSKQQLNMEAIKELPYEICQILNDINEDSKKTSAQQKNLLFRYSEIISKVLVYGSCEAVSIAVYMQQTTYQSNGDTDNESKWKLMAGWSLLITQLKYDLTDVVISPETWFKLKIKDYEDNKAPIQNAINELIKTLGLNDDFWVQ